MTHATAAELDAHLAAIRSAPAEEGRIELLLRRPAKGERELLDSAELSTEVGLVGDMWPTRPSRTGPDGGPDPEKQVTLMNLAALRAVAGERERWQLAGDQIIVDLDLSAENLPPETRLAVGTAVLVVSATPHNGCAKFSARFGSQAMRWVNSKEGRALRLRGVNARVERGGTVRVGDSVRKL